ncbi:MAG: hypothetical protein AB7S71_04695 [Dongiaceae bacterium]
MQRAFITAMVLGCAACGLTAPDMTAYQGPDLGDQQLAVVENRGDCPFCIVSIEREGYLYFDASRDGLRKSVKLAPGAYEVTYEYRSYKTQAVRRSDTIELKAGHIYDVKRDVCYMFCFDMPSYTTYLWIEDSATGQVVAGVRP